MNLKYFSVMSTILNGFGYTITKLLDCKFIFNAEKPWLGTLLDVWIQVCIIDDEAEDGSEDGSSKHIIEHELLFGNENTNNKKASEIKCINVPHTTQNTSGVSLEMKSSKELYTSQNIAIKSYTIQLQLESKTSCSLLQVNIIKSSLLLWQFPNMIASIMYHFFKMYTREA